MKNMAIYPRAVYLCWLSSAGLPLDALQKLVQLDVNQLFCLMDRIRHGDSMPAEIPLAGKALSVLKNNSAEHYLDQWADLLEKHQIQVCVPLDGIYPENLLRTQDPPALLFYIGKMLPEDVPSAAIVGSRSASWKGMEATEKIASRLSEAGVSIVSGLAYGIDTAAHKGCLKGGSPTAAVMGCGLDQDYPAENRPLKCRILEQGGVILSEYPPGEKPLGWHFPVRNRIISGLSSCVILMEARIRSGSMTTVQHALNQGRDVFVYPGDPESLKCEGNHQLLREGAIYFTKAEDILEDMGWLDKKKEVGQNSDCASSVDALSDSEQSILSLLQRGAMGLDELCEATGTAAGPMMAQLTMMQITGLITALPGKKYGIKG